MRALGRKCAIRHSSRKIARFSGAKASAFVIRQDRAAQEPQEAPPLLLTRFSRSLPTLGRFGLPGAPIVASWKPGCPAALGAFDLALLILCGKYKPGGFLPGFGMALAPPKPG